MALVSMQGFYNKMGEELLILLPETIIYLSELLEGTQTDMVQACTRLIETTQMMTWRWSGKTRR
jgi:hypothetical protein